MKMGRLSKAALIGAFTLCAPATAAIAADMPEPPVFEPPPPVAYGGWYLRGYIGMTNQDFDGMEHPSFEAANYFEWLHEGEFDAGMLFGAGVGYTFNEWFRVDLTGEYRGKTDFSAMDRYSGNNPPAFGDVDEEWGVNEYDAKKSEWLFLANAYLDLGEWHRITPYVGAGIGASYNRISGFTDNGFNSNDGDVTATGGFAGDNGEWDLAWALHAGLAFKATKNLTIDVGYSFLNLGDGKTDTFTAANGECSENGCHAVTFKDIISHDIKVGFRWEFGGDDYVDYEPAVVKY